MKKLPELPEPDDAEVEEYDRQDEIDELAERFRINRDARALVDNEGWAPPKPAKSLDWQLRNPPQPVAYVVDELAPRNSVIALLAQWKAGKTHLAMNFLADASAGRPFLGKYGINLRKGTGFTYTNWEVGESQALSWIGDMELGKTRNFYMDHWQGESLPILNPRVEEWITELLLKRKSSVWISDTWGSWYDGEINDNTLVAKWTKVLDRIRLNAKLDLLMPVVHTGTGSDFRSKGATKLMEWPTGFWSWRHGGAGQDLPPDNKRYFRAFGRDIDTGPIELTIGYDTVNRRLYWDPAAPSRSGATAERAARAIYEAVKAWWERENRPCNQQEMFDEMKLGKSESAKTQARAAQVSAHEKKWINAAKGPGGWEISLGVNNPHAEVRKTR